MKSKEDDAVKFRRERETWRVLESPLYKRGTDKKGHLIEASLCFSEQRND